MQKKTVIISTIISILFSLNVYSQELDSIPRYGLTASMQANQFDVIIPFWDSNTLKIAPAFGFVSINDVGQDFSLGIIISKYLNRKKVSPYVSFRGGLLIAVPENGDSVTDTVLGLAFGGEYFFEKYLSLGIEAQINASISNKRSYRFGNPDKTILNTSMAIFGSIYFD